MIMLKLLFAGSLLVLTHGMQHQLVLTRGYVQGQSNNFPGYGTWTVDEKYRPTAAVPMKFKRRIHFPIKVSSHSRCAEFLIIRVTRSQVQSKVIQPGTYFYSRTKGNWYTASNLWEESTTSGPVRSTWFSTNKTGKAGSLCKKVAHGPATKTKPIPPRHHKKVVKKVSHGPAPSAPLTGDYFILQSTSPALNGTWCRCGPNKYMSNTGYILASAEGASYFCDNGEKKYETKSDITKNNDSTWTHTKYSSTRVKTKCVKKTVVFRVKAKPVKPKPVKSSPLHRELQAFYESVPFFGQNDYSYYAADMVLRYTLFHPLSHLTHYIFAMRENGNVVLKKLRADEAKYVIQNYRNKFQQPNVFLKQDAMVGVLVNGHAIHGRIRTL